MTKPFNHSKNYIPPGPNPSPDTRSTFSTTKAPRPPIHNPYDKFTQPEFEDWIGGITGALKRALGQEEILSKTPGRYAHLMDGGYDADTSYGELTGAYDDGETYDSAIIEDSFAEIKARRVAKGKARDDDVDAYEPGQGDENEPIEIGSDSDPGDGEEWNDESYQDAGQTHPSDHDSSYHNGQIEESLLHDEAGDEGEPTTTYPPQEDDDVIELLDDEEVNDDSTTQRQAYRTAGAHDEEYYEEGEEVQEAEEGDFVDDEGAHEYGDDAEYEEELTDNFNEFHSHQIASGSNLPGRGGERHPKQFSTSQFSMSEYEAELAAFLTPGVLTPNIHVPELPSVQESGQPSEHVVLTAAQDEDEELMYDESRPEEEYEEEAGEEQAADDEIIDVDEEEEQHEEADELDDEEAEVQVLPQGRDGLDEEHHAEYDLGEDEEADELEADNADEDIDSSSAGSSPVEEDPDAEHEAGYDEQSELHDEAENYDENLAHDIEPDERQDGQPHENFHRHDGEITKASEHGLEVVPQGGTIGDEDEIEEIDNPETLPPVEIPDPWAPVERYAQDYYSGGDLRPEAILQADAHNLGQETEENLGHQHVQDIRHSEEPFASAEDTPILPQETLAGQTTRLGLSPIQDSGSKLEQPTILEPQEGSEDVPEAHGAIQIHEEHLEDASAQVKESGDVLDQNDEVNAQEDSIDDIEGRDLAVGHLSEENQASTQHEAHADDVFGDHSDAGDEDAIPSGQAETTIPAVEITDAEHQEADHYSVASSSYQDELLMYERTGFVHSSAPSPSALQENLDELLAPDVPQERSSPGLTPGASELHEDQVGAEIHTADSELEAQISQGVDDDTALRDNELNHASDEPKAYNDNEMTVVEPDEMEGITDSSETNIRDAIEIEVISGESGYDHDHVEMSYLVVEPTETSPSVRAESLPAHEEHSESHTNRASYSPYNLHGIPPPVSADPNVPDPASRQRTPEGRAFASEGDDRIQSSSVDGLQPPGVETPTGYGGLFTPGNASPPDTTSSTQLVEVVDAPSDDVVADEDGSRGVEQAGEEEHEHGLEDQHLDEQADIGDHVVEEETLAEYNDEETVPSSLLDDTQVASDWDLESKQPEQQVDEETGGHQPAGEFSEADETAIEKEESAEHYPDYEVAHTPTAEISVADDSIIEAGPEVEADEAVEHGADDLAALTETAGHPDEFPTETLHDDDGVAPSQPSVPASSLPQRLPPFARSSFGVTLTRKATDPILHPDPYPASLSTPIHDLDLDGKDLPEEEIEQDNSFSSSSTAEKEADYLGEGSGDGARAFELDELEEMELRYPSEDPLHTAVDEPSDADLLALADEFIAAGGHATEEHDADADGDIDPEFATTHPPDAETTLVTSGDAELSLEEVLGMTEVDAVHSESNADAHVEPLIEEETTPHVTSVTVHGEDEAIGKPEELETHILSEPPPSSNHENRVTQPEPPVVGGTSPGLPADSPSTDSARPAKRKRRSSPETETPSHITRSHSAKIETEELSNGDQKLSRKKVSKASTKKKTDTTARQDKGKGKAKARASSVAQSEESWTSSSASVAARMLNTGSRTASRASSVVSVSEKSDARHESPTVAMLAGNITQPQLAPPPLFHAHSRPGPQLHHHGNQPQQPLQKQIQKSNSATRAETIDLPETSTRSSAATQAAPSHPSAPSHRPAPTSNSPVTRSNCRYHKISLPREEGGPRVCFLVPGCSLGDRELMEEEEIEDHGNATHEDSLHIIRDIESLDFSSYLIGILRQLVGVDLLREQEVYYLPQPGEVPVRKHRKSLSTYARPREVTVADSSSFHGSPRSKQSRSPSRAPVSVAESTSTTLSGIWRVKGSDKGSFSTASDYESGTEDETRKAKRARRSPENASSSSGKMGPPIVPKDVAKEGTLKRRRSKRLGKDSAEYKPDADDVVEEIEEVEERVKSHRKSTTARGTKRARNEEPSATVVEQESEERKNKKPRTRTVTVAE